ncbi:2-dehydropantoate 2-reductase, partial [Arthrobacter deserti]|nr:2-dehydropantoate 2-reductase [Arthrobacter deserti]
MDIGILGAGAMGQLFGARLQLAGNTVAFIDAAPATNAALNHGGITLTTGGRRKHTAVRTGAAADFDEPFDLIIVFTKGFHTAAALESVRHLTGPRTHGLTLQNGLGNGEVLAGHFGPDRTWVGVTGFPAGLERPGVLPTSADGKVRLGPFRAGPRPFARQLADLLSAAGLNADVPPDIQAAIWEKAAFNAALNSISAVTGQTVGAIGASSQGRELVRSILGETAA